MTITNDISFSQTLLNLKAGGRLSVRSNVVNVYTAGGFNFGAALENQSKRIETTSINNVTTEVTEHSLLAGATAGLWISGGVKLNFNKGGAFADVQYEKALYGGNESFDIFTPRIGMIYRVQN
jgi:hypothetical protein